MNDLKKQIERNQKQIETTNEIIDFHIDGAVKGLYSINKDHLKRCYSIIFNCEEMIKIHEEELKGLEK